MRRRSSLGLKAWNGSRNRSFALISLSTGGVVVQSEVKTTAEDTVAVVVGEAVVIKERRAEVGTWRRLAGSRSVCVRVDPYAT